MSFAAVPPARQAELLSPYREASTHVVAATVGREADGVLALHADLHFGASAHRRAAGEAIDGIEANIAYNQMLYLGLGEAVAGGLDPVFDGWSWELYRQRQLPNVLILAFEFCRSAPAPARGEVRGVLRFESFVRKRTLILVETRASLRDARGGVATCDVTVGIVDEAPTRPEPADRPETPP